MDIVILLIVLIFAVLPIFAGLIVLQVFLSKKENLWLGLILPLVSFLLSFLYPVFMLSTGDPKQDAVMFVVALLLGNIPTAVFLIIYAANRHKHGKKSQLKKMNIQDLG